MYLMVSMSCTPKLFLDLCRVHKDLLMHHNRCQIQGPTTHIWKNFFACRSDVLALDYKLNISDMTQIMFSIRFINNVNFIIIHFLLISFNKDVILNTKIFTEHSFRFLNGILLNNYL